MVDKPPFLLIHPTKPNETRNLWKELRELLAFEIASGGQVSIVNRLVQKQRLRKEYFAIVWDWPEWDKKIVDAPLDRQTKHQQSAIWLKQMIHAAGALARTEFRVERRFVKSTAAGDRFSLIRAIPRTGRTHQIRVHLSSVDHPIVGDKIYGTDEQLYLRFIETGWTSELEQRLLLPRHALHSAKLAIEGECEWNSPLPVDLAGFIR